jgi:sirohydrochlorin cobaltochelatase
VAIQSLHIINGDEYEKIVREVQSMRPLFSRLTLGVPLLSSHEDYAQLMLALQQQMPTLEKMKKWCLWATAPAITPLPPMPVSTI